MKCWLPPITAYQTVPKSGDIVAITRKEIARNVFGPLAQQKQVTRSLNNSSEPPTNTFSH